MAGESSEVVSLVGMEMRAKALEDVLTGLSAHTQRCGSSFVRMRTHLRAMSKGLGVVPEAKPTTGGEPRERVLTPLGSFAVHVG